MPSLEDWVYALYARTYCKNPLSSQCRYFVLNLRQVVAGLQWDACSVFLIDRMWVDWMNSKSDGM